MVDLMQNNREESLDPENWTAVQDLAHTIIDDAVAHVSGVRDRPVWQEMPDEVRESYLAPCPDSPTPLSQVYIELNRNLIPYPMGNIHPRFWG